MKVVFNVYPRYLEKHIYRKIEVDELLLKKISNGVRIDNLYNEDMVMFTYNNEPVSIYVRDNNILKSYRVFNKNKNELLK